MAVNRQGVFCRTVDNEEEDREQMFLNIRDQKWQEWPNEAGVSVWMANKYAVVTLLTRVFEV